MSIEITVRHLEIGDAVKAEAQEKAERLIEKFNDIEFIHIVLDKDGPFFAVTVAAQGGHNHKIESSGKEPGVREALQDAFEKTETQLRKNTQRMRERK